jgi:hypothetical protein
MPTCQPPREPSRHEDLTDLAAYVRQMRALDQLGSLTLARTLGNRLRNTPPAAQPQAASQPPPSARIKPTVD